MTSAVNPTTNGAAIAAPQKPQKQLPPLWTPPDRPSPLKPRRLLRRPRQKRSRTIPPPLRFSPTAWSKLVCLRDAGPTEIGGFGITPSDDLLLVEDIQLVRQTCTVTSVEFDDAAVAELFDEQVDQGLRPEQFARIWIHTHPGLSAMPSSVDETTFRNVFGRCDWSVMFILAKGGATHARLQFRAGPGGALRLPVRIDWRRPFGGTDELGWQTEYDMCVQPLDGWGAAWEQEVRNQQAARVAEPVDAWSDRDLFREQFLIDEPQSETA